MLQKFILDRMIKITPQRYTISELAKVENYWHRFGEEVTENHYKSLCGKVIITTPNYVVANLELYKDYEICSDCLKMWHENSESKFETDQMMGRYELRLEEENAEFVKLLIENDGYDKFEELVDSLLSNYLKENNLLEKLRYKMSQRQN